MLPFPTLAASDAEHGYPRKSVFMLLPRFSLRTTLLIVTGSAVVLFFTSFGVAGRTWGIALCAALLSLAAGFGMHYLFYLACSGLTRLLGAEEVVARTSRGALTPGAAPQPVAASHADVSLLVPRQAGDANDSAEDCP